MKRQVILHFEDGGYWAEVPSLPGCYSQGYTRQEALDNIKEAIEIHIEALLDAGDPVPDDDDMIELVNVEIWEE